MKFVKFMLVVAGSISVLFIVLIAVAASTPKSTPASATQAKDGLTLAGQSQETQSQFHETWGDQADVEWAKEHNAEPPQPTPAPKPWDYTVKSMSTGTPIILLSEDEVKDMQTHVTTINQVAGYAGGLPKYHGVANLSAGTHLKATGDRTYTLELASPGNPSVSLPFYPVRVVDGPAMGSRGWIPATGISN